MKNESPNMDDTLASYPLFPMTRLSRSDFDEAMEDLTELQRRFVHNLLLDPTSRRKAAIAAGVSAKKADERASIWMGNPKVAHAISVAMNAREERTMITQDRVVQELAIIGFSDIADFEIDEFGNVTLRPGTPEHVMRAVSSLKKRTFRDNEGNLVHETEIKFWSKTEALKLIMAHLGMGQTKKVEHGGAIGHMHAHVHTWKVGDREISF